MKNKTLLALLALSALAAACRERRQDPAPDYNGVRARANAAGQGLQQQTPPPDGAR